MTTQEWVFYVQGASLGGGQGDIASRLMLEITRVILWFIRAIIMITKFPGPSEQTS